MHNGRSKLQVRHNLKIHFYLSIVKYHIYKKKHVTRSFFKKTEEASSILYSPDP